jgi:hypothetical protein
MPNNEQYLDENQDHKLKNMLSGPIQITIVFWLFINEYKHYLTPRKW